MDSERYIPDPNQTMHPGTGRVERYNDTNGAVYETTWHDAHGHTYTTGHQLGPAERYGYDYVGGAPSATRPQTSWQAPDVVPAVPSDDHFINTSPDRNRGSDDEGEQGLSEGFGILVLVALGVVLGPLILGFFGVFGVPRRSRWLGYFLIALEPGWLLWLRYWLADDASMWPAVVLTSIPFAVLAVAWAVNDWRVLRARATRS
ncbi:hypothetical protein [Streptomyces sp. NPDC005281]|uniref:hypothetical protein n=1 Tax=Streptomyces sp. NPDC005281 TaxID=3155712 RepID=UPI0033BD0924